MSRPESLGIVSVVRFKGTYDWAGLIRVIRAWFEEHEYDFFERRYKHKDQELGAELEINFEATREMNEFAKEHIKMYFHIWDQNDVEVVKDGKKRIMQKGRFYVEFTGTLELDYENRWESTAFKRTMRDFYINYIIRKEIDNVWGDRLWYDINLLQQDVKRFLGMQTESDVYDDMW